MISLNHVDTGILWIWNHYLLQLVGSTKVWYSPRCKTLSANITTSSFKLHLVIAQYFSSVCLVCFAVSFCVKFFQEVDDKVSEFEVWQGLANLYASLSYWRDAEICLQKAKALKSFSAITFHAEGEELSQYAEMLCLLPFGIFMQCRLSIYKLRSLFPSYILVSLWFPYFHPGYTREVREQTQDALAAYFNAVSTEVEHVPSKVSIGALLSKQGPKYLPVARSFLSDALRHEPTNRMAWFYLGKVHKHDGRLADAADCFQAASMLEESDPIESFRSLWWLIILLQQHWGFPFSRVNFSSLLFFSSYLFLVHSWVESGYQLHVTFVSVGASVLVTLLSDILTKWCNLAAKW